MKKFYTLKMPRDENGKLKFCLPLTVLLQSEMCLKHKNNFTILTKIRSFYHHLNENDTVSNRIPVGLNPI